MQNIYQNFDFNYLKTVYKMLRRGIFPAFDNTYAANILGMWEIWVDFTPHVRMLLPSEPVWQYSCTKLPKKLTIKIEHIKMMQIPCFDI